MALFDRKPLVQCKEDDLLALIADGQLEGKTIEYKRDQVGRGDPDKKEFLYDVSSFANTLGGHVIFGMDEKDGAPTNLIGLPGINSDDEVLRLEQIIRDGIRPPIVGVQSKPVPLANGNAAIVMRIPKSWNPPHQVTYQKAFRFYARGSNGKYQLDVDELRSIFTFSASAAERLRLFRIERLAKIVAADTPASLQTGAKMVTHILPLAAFTTRHVVDLTLLMRDLTSLVGVLGAGGSPLFNVDGLLLSSLHANGWRYVQVFRDGCIEVISNFSQEAAKRASLPSPAFERVTINQLYHGKKMLQYLGVAPPIVIMLTLVGMKGWRIMAQSDGSAGTFDRDPVFLPELVLETFDNLNQDELKPLLDTAWNAAGSAGSPNYDRDGRRKRDDT
jgi:hypothetical protein